MADKNLVLALGPESARGSLSETKKAIKDGQISFAYSDMLSGVRTDIGLPAQDARLYLDLNGTTRIPVNAFFADYSHYASCISATQKNTTKGYLLAIDSSNPTDKTPHYDSGIYISTTSGTLVAKQLSGFATKAGALYASKSASAGIDVGSTTQPVYFAAGVPVVADAYSTILTDATSSASTNFSVTAGGTTKSITNLYASYMKTTNSNTATAYILGSTGTDTTPVYDTGVYLSSTAGVLVAKQLTGFATKAGALYADNSKTEGIDVGGVNQPVYFSKGVPVIANAYSTILTGATSTAATNLSVTAAGTTKSVTGLYATYMKTSNNNTVKAYVLGSTATDTTPVYDSGVYLSTTAGTIVATTFSGNATSATKLTSSAGSATQPVYFSDGKPVVANAYSTLLTDVSSSADTNLSVVVGGTTKSAASVYATYMKATNNNTTKAYLLGTTGTNTTPIYDSSVYLSTTSGALVASSMQTGSLSSTSVELNTNGSLASYGGFIDFHYHDADKKPTDAAGNIVTSTPDYTSRIIESAAGTIAVNGVRFKSDKITSGTWNGSTIAVGYGGTGKTTHTANAVLTGNGTSAVNNVSTASGAFYATSAGGAPQFGTLPVAQGGTGNTAQSANRLIYSESTAKLSSSGHYASSTKMAINSTSAPASSYTFYVNGATGFSSGHIYLTGAAANSSTANTTQLVFGTPGGTDNANNHVVLSSNNNALVINPTINSTTNQIVLYLDSPSMFPSGLNAGGSITFSALKASDNTRPLMVNTAGTASVGSLYAGGTAVTLNGASKAASTASFYAPTGGGTSGYYLRSNGSSAPSWTNVVTVQVLTADPTSPSKGQIWINTSV